MAKIPFDIKYRPQIESGEYKVETRDGRPVRIVCWDCQSEDYPLVALISQGKFEDTRIYTIDGRYYNDQLTSVLNLFLITSEPELTEFEKEYIRLYKEGYADGQAGSKPISDDNLKEYATELLVLARKEIEDELKEKVLHDYWKQVTDRYIQERKEGKAEALKDLPRWRKSVGRQSFNKSVIVLTNTNHILCANCTDEGDYYIPFSDLKKLPKEDEK